MGYIFQFQDAVTYQAWHKSPRNQFILELEHRLMLDLLKPVRGYNILDIGCGIGTTLQFFTDCGLEATGVEPSPYMLDAARKKVGNRADLYRCFGEDLPFDDNSFNYACLFTSLEFVDNPQKVLEEACRVAKNKLFIGILNRYSAKSVQIRVRGMFTQTVYNRARFFSIWGIKRKLHTVLGDVPITWKTVRQVPLLSGFLTHWFERSQMAQQSPLGDFAGIVVTLIPRFKTRTLPLAVHPKRTAETVPSLKTRLNSGLKSRTEKMEEK
ncbi:class I SAM-dependent methyltransferase [Desulfococcaceae bacterium HSG9]|nr:class I SAM-dependent methyltransferase [Desulfococcaceae bacterium HSG9]